MWSTQQRSIHQEMRLRRDVEKLHKITSDKDKDGCLKMAQCLLYLPT